MIPIGLPRNVSRKSNRAGLILSSNSSGRVPWDSRGPMESLSVSLLIHFFADVSGISLSPLKT